MVEAVALGDSALTHGSLERTDSVRSEELLSVRVPDDGDVSEDDIDSDDVPPPSKSSGKPLPARQLTNGSGMSAARRRLSMGGAQGTAMAALERLALERLDALAQVREELRVKASHMSVEAERSAALMREAAAEEKAARAEAAVTSLQAQQTERIGTLDREIALTQREMALDEREGC